MNFPTRPSKQVFIIAAAAIAILGAYVPLANAATLQFNFAKEQMFYQMSEDFVHHTGYGAAAMVEAPIGSFTSLLLNGTHALNQNSEDQEEWNYRTPRPPGLIKEDLDADFPSSSTYTFSYAGGSLGTDSFAIDIGPDAYPALTPSLAPGSYTAAQSVDPTQAFTLYWNDHSTVADIIIIDWFANGVFNSSEDLLPTTTSFVFPAHTFTPENMFEIEIHFIKVSVMDLDENATGYMNILTVPLTTVPEPRAYALLFGIVVVASALLRKRTR